jgi:hypothetical protein
MGHTPHRVHRRVTVRAERKTARDFLPVLLKLDSVRLEIVQHPFRIRFGEIESLTIARRQPIRHERLNNRGGLPVPAVRTMPPSARSAPIPHRIQHRPRSSQVAIFFKASITFLASSLDSGFLVRE